MSTDLVSDALIRIKNGYMARKGQVILPFSNLIVAVCQVLKQEGYLEKVDVDGNKVTVLLRYNQKLPVVSGIKKISKPGLRVYKKKSDLPRVLNGLGVAVISTPKGVMTDKQARKEGVGGEVIAYIW